MVLVTEFETSQGSDFVPTLYIGKSGSQSALSGYSTFYGYFRNIFIYPVVLALLYQVYRTTCSVPKLYCFIFA